MNSTDRIRDNPLTDDRERSGICRPVPGLDSSFVLGFIPLKQHRKWRVGVATKSKIIEGRTFCLIVEEVNEHDPNGGRLLYLASIYLQVRGSARMHLVRRSRVPGSAWHLERDARLGRIDVGRLIDVLRIDVPAS